MNEDTIAGKLKSAGGKIEQHVGEAVGNEKMANAGAANQVKGAAEETWGKTKDVAHDVVASSKSEGDAHAHQTGHNVRASVTNAAEHAKEAIHHGLDDVKAKLHEEKEVHQVH